MIRGLQILIVVGFLAGAGPVFAADDAERPNSAVALRDLQATYPGVRAFEETGRVRSVYGRAMATGETAVAAAEQFRQAAAPVFGVESDDLRPGLRRVDNRQTQPLMYDRETGKYKFTLVYYSQYHDGVPVFRSDLRVLVRNEPGFPVVQANSSLHDLGSFAGAARAVRADPDLAQVTATTVIPDLVNFTTPETVVWAGVDDLIVDPVLAVTFVADNGMADAGDYEKWRFVVDAATGEILHQEDLVILEDVEGNVGGMATTIPKAEQCAPEVITRMPYASVSIQGGSSAYADAGGNFVIPHGSSTEVTVESPIRGQYFRVYNQAGSDALLTKTVTPPGPANFLHNEWNNDEYLRAQVNAYVQANIVRDFVLANNPSYPVISGQTNFTIRVNRTDFYCPGNAWYDGSALNFCSSDIPNHPNTAFSSVAHHEYGHHVVEMGGSGQDQYGEGMADCMSMLIADDPGLGYGFFYSQCNTPLRNADNTYQYPCTGEAHECGQLLSGCVWSTRNELAATHPDDYLEIVSNLTVNSVPMHSGTVITPQITIDFLTLDDDDANLDNGTPHWSQICAGFGAHNMDCPALALLDFEYPEGLPSLIPPGEAATIRVNVLPVSATPIPGTGTVTHQVDDGGFTTVPMTEVAPNEYEAELPAASCAATIEYYFGAEADASGGTSVTDPADGPDTTFAAIVGTDIVTLVSFDFESAPGWTVSGNASDGQWGIGVPVNYGRGDPPGDFDGSGKCYLTDNVAGNSDVDGGTTILTSPAFDLSNGIDPRVSYARWYSNVEGDSPQADTFVVRVSNDNGVNWAVLETVGPSGPEVTGGWYAKTFRIADYVDPTTDVRVRFEASDLGNGSIVEAAVDAFEIFDVECGAEPPSAAPAPHDLPTNRYLSFVPQNTRHDVAFQLEMIASTRFPSSLGVIGWVGEPEELAPGLSVARVVDAPVYREWTESVIHVADCEIVPAAAYEIRATAEGMVFSDPLEVSTVMEPMPKYWADVVGEFSGTVWSGPNGEVNMNDVTAAVQKFQQLPTAPPLTWVDLDAEAPNGVLNFTDIMRIVQGFKGEPYPFSDPAACP